MGSWEGIRRTVRATRYEFITLLAFFKNTTETHILNYCTRYAIGIRADFVSLVVVLPGMCFSFFRAVLYIDLKISTGWGTFRFFFFELHKTSSDFSLPSASEITPLKVNHVILTVLIVFEVLL